MKRKAPPELMFELDGPGVEPATVDTVAFLRLAEAFFQMMLRLANAESLGLTFRGIEIRNKCAAIVSHPSNVASARIAAEGAGRIVRGAQAAPSGTEGLQGDIRKYLRELPPETKAAVRIGKKIVRVQAPAPRAAHTPWETTELRVVPLRVSARRVELASHSEGQPFTLVLASVGDARKLGASIQQEIDVLMTVCRGVDGNIVEGRIEKVFELQTQNIAESWRAWFADAGDWGRIEDVREELGRN
jgi:hypothetical protein